MYFIDSANILRIFVANFLSIVNHKNQKSVKDGAVSNKTQK